MPVTIDQVGVKATDDKTLVITCEGRRAYFPVLAAYTAAAPSYQKAVEQFGDKWTEAANIVCNGPFMLTEWKHNESFTLKRNDNYWNASTITLTQLNCPIIDATAEFTAYQNGEIDISLHGALGNLNKVQGDSTLKNEYHKYNLFGTWYLEPNIKHGAVRYQGSPPGHGACRRSRHDRQQRAAWISATVAYNLTPPGMPGFDPNKYEDFTTYDPEKAKSLLAGTPYEGGKNWPTITMTQRNNEGDAPVAAGDAIIAMLKQNLGMNIQHELGDPKDVYNRAYAGRIQLMWWRWYIDYPDPNNDDVSGLLLEVPNRRA